MGGLDNGCPLCFEAPVKEFKYWRIIDNKFPYDRIAKVHHILAPKRHIIEGLLTKNELKELLFIKQIYVAKHYNIILEATARFKTIPEHFHLHLIITKYGDEVRA